MKKLFEKAVTAIGKHTGRINFWVFGLMCTTVLATDNTLTEAFSIVGFILMTWTTQLCQEVYEEKATEISAVIGSDRK